MRKFFQYIHRKPKNVRDNYALAAASFFTILVLMVWLVARPEGKTLIAGADSTNEAALPFTTLMKETKEKFSEMRSSLVEVEQDGVANNTQGASVISASTTSPEELILSEEDIEIARQDFEESSSENYMLDKSNFIEVMIATSTAQATTESACTDMSTTSTSSAATASCFGSIKTATTTTQ